MSENEVKRVASLSNDEYVDEVNTLLDKIEDYCKQNGKDFLKMLIETDYSNMLNDLLACRECGELYKDIDIEDKYWISSFLLSEQPYSIWRECRPKKSGEVVGESLKKLSKEYKDATLKEVTQHEWNKR